MFRPYIKRPFSNYELLVFDRWGDLLFQSKDHTAGWDGTARGQRMGPGVYTWVIHFDFINEKGAPEKFLMSGDVLLVR